MNITKTSLILTQLILLFLLNQCGSQHKCPEEMTHHIRLIEKKEQEKTLQIYNDVISKNPDNPTVYFLRATLYAKMGQTENMLRDLDNAMNLAESKLEVKPNDPEALFVKGVFYYLRNNDMENAKVYLTKSIETSSPPLEAYYFRALIFWKEGDNEKAISDATAMIDSNIQEIDLEKNYYFRGMIYDSNDKSDKAFEDFSTAIKLNPNYADPYFKRSEILTRQRKMREAKRDIEKAFKLVPNPTDWRAYMVSGEIAHSESKYEKAIGDFTRALEIEPDSALLHILRGDAFIGLHEFESAYNDHKMAVTLEPDNSSAHASYAFAIWAHTHDIHEAIKRFDIALELDPNNQRALEMRQKAVDHLASMEDE